MQKLILENKLKTKPKDVKKQWFVNYFWIYQNIIYKKTAKIDVKIFNKTQNKLNNFNQNYGFIKNTHIEFVVLNEQNEIFVTFTSKTDDNGLFSSKFFSQENIPQETFTIEITAENENSKSFKTIEIFNLAKRSD